jgi:hypothetical protein
MKTNYATLKYETILFNSCFKVGDVILYVEKKDSAPVKDQILGNAVVIENRAVVTLKNHGVVPCKCCYRNNTFYLS